MSKLRVLHVNKLYAPYIGGVEQTVQMLAEETASDPDFEVEVLVCQPRGRTTVENLNGVKLTRVASAGIALSMPLAPTFPAVLGRMKNAFDVVHVHVPFPLALFGGLGSTPGGPRVVVHYHCDVSRPDKKAILTLLHPWTRRLFDAADRIVVTSDSMRRESEVLHPHDAKCCVIPLPVRFPERPPLDAARKAELRRRFGLPEGEKLVLFVGRLVYYKGLDILLSAMRGVPGRLLVVGEGPLRGAVERQAAELGIAGRVSLLGGVDDDTLQALYGLADVFVLPSTAKAEAFGLVQLEAMSRGCPVVNTNLPTGVPSVSLDGTTGLTVPPRDVGALAGALRTLLEDDALRARYGANARVRARSFSTAAIGARVRDLYLELAGDRVAGLAERRQSA